MLGEASYFPIPEVIGVHLTGELPKIATATDLALKIPPPLPFAVSMIPIPAPVTTPPMMIPMTGSAITAVAGVGTIEVNKLIPTVPRIVFIKNVFPILNHAINKIGMLSSK